MTTAPLQSRSGTRITPPAGRGMDAAHARSASLAPRVIPAGGATVHPQAAPTPTPTRSAEPASRRWHQHLPALSFAVATLAAIATGLVADTGRYLTAESGLGYALGIVGGSMMLALLLYSARKRLPGLRRIGSTTAWFKAHMIMGVLGPLLILYHSNFSLGATNSNVALFCMLAVASSGLVGRYIYSRIHHGLYGHQATLAELQGDAERLRTQVSKLKIVPDLIARLETAERSVLATRTPLLLRPAVVMFRAWRWRRRLAQHLHRQIGCAASSSQALHDHGGRFEKVVNRYVRERLEATRRVAEFDNYQRLFAWWHVLHLPLFVMMIVSGIVHVIAVHIY